MSSKKQQACWRGTPSRARLAAGAPQESLAGMASAPEPAAAASRPPTRLAGRVPSQYIRLDVGGSKYTTTLATLTKHRDSMLGRMFAGLDADDVDDDINASASMMIGLARDDEVSLGGPPHLQTCAVPTSCTTVTVRALPTSHNHRVHTSSTATGRAFGALKPAPKSDPHPSPSPRPPPS